MMVETVYNSEDVFREAFTVFNSMRQSSEHTDLVLRGDGEADLETPGGIPCHRLVLASVSPYFRAMFRSEASSGQEVRIHGVDMETLNTIVNYCYTGSLQLTLDSVVSLVSAGDLLLLDWVVARCQQFLTDNIHLDNVITAARLASLYRMGDLDKLALKYQETQFSDLVSSQDWLELSEEEVTRLVSSDGVIAPESLILEAILSWWTEAELSDQRPEVLSSLLSEVRWPLCGPSLLTSLETEARYSLVIQSQAYRDFRAATASPQHSLANPLSKTARKRGDADLLVVHHDASDHLHCYSPDTGQWRVLTDLPPGAGHEYAAITGQQSKVYLVGGRSRDGRSLRSVFCYDLATATWSRLADMKEVRWYHGACVIGTRLYAVLGCTQLDSTEALDLASDTWVSLPSLGCPRHLPGVTSLDTGIWVCGGSDDNWTAHATVEMLDTRTNTWTRLPDMLVPRIQPTVVAYDGMIYAMGGRNSNKVELMSVERFSPEAGAWQMVKEMRKKRWGGGGAVLHRRLVVVGGKGKRVGATGEVWCESEGVWSALAGETPASERAYNACVVTRPWNWDFPD